MTHSDDDGLVLPPRLAPTHVVILPITQQGRGSRSACSSTATQLARRAARAAVRTTRRSGSSSTSATCAAATRCGSGSRRACRCASRSARATSTRTRVFMGRRDKPPKDKAARAARRVRRAASPAILQEIQDGLFARAKAFRERAHAADRHARTSSTRSSPIRAKKKPNDPTPIHGGFALTHFNGDPELEAEDQGRPQGHRALHPARRRRARHVPVHRQAEQAARRLGEVVLARRF